MARAAYSFPHIPRLFSAFLWLTLVALITLNFYAVRTLKPNTAGFLPLLLQPFSSAIHSKVAQELWNEGHAQEAKREAKIAQILGASQEATSLLSQWEQEPKKIQEAYDHWKQIAILHPDYADAFLLSSIYAYQLGNINEAKKNIQEASALHPSSLVISQFFELLQ